MGTTPGNVGGGGGGAGGIGGPTAGSHILGRLTQTERLGVQEEKTLFKQYSILVESGGGGGGVSNR